MLNYIDITNSLHYLEVIESLRVIVSKDLSCIGNLQGIIDTLKRHRCTFAIVQVGRKYRVVRAPVMGDNPANYRDPNGEAWCALIGDIAPDHSEIIQLWVDGEL